MRNALERALDVRLPSTLVFDYPTPAALSEHITDLLQSRAGAPRTAINLPISAAPRRTLAGKTRHVGIMAAVHRLPGGIRGGTAMLPGVLTPADDSGTVLPLARWDIDTAAMAAASDVGHGKPASQVRFAHLLGGVDTFDARLFGSTGVEAALMDPQQRLLLECIAKAVLPCARAPEASLQDDAAALEVGGSAGSQHCCHSNFHCHPTLLNCRIWCTWIAPANYSEHG
jgi:hypothetical protein